MRWFVKLLVLVAVIVVGYFVYYSSSGGSGRPTLTQSPSSSTRNAPPSSSDSRDTRPPSSGAKDSRAHSMGGELRTVVKVSHAKMQPIRETVSSLGTVIPSQSVTVRSQVEGTLQALYFEEGQAVKKGDLLAKIDPRSYQATLDQAKGSLAQNQAKLANARQDLKRYQILFKQDSIARQEVETQQALVREYEGAQKSLQASVDQAALNLSYTDITAPIDGRLGLRTVDVGNLVSANSTEGLVVITQTQPIDVSFAIPDRYISQVASDFYAGKTLNVEVLDKNNAHILAKGHLVSMDNQVDTTTGTIKLKARFDNQDYALFPNQFVNARIILQALDNTLVLSNDAIQYNDEGAFVYIVQADNTVKAQTISLGIVDNGFTQILSGLNPQDNIVVEGLDRLRNGAKVEIVP